MITEDNMTDVKEIQLNESQTEILKGLVAWSYDKDKSNLFATLKGSAGTGKTTVTNQFIKECAFKYGVVVSAPTHKAKKVIENATQLNSYTIQKLLGLRPNTDLDNFNINFPQFDTLAECTIQDYRLLIIDEASMLNSDLFDLICENAIRYNVKVLFIGDELQLPPVKEKMSRAITDVKNQFGLTVIVRQKNTNPLADLLIALRKDIVEGTRNFEQLLVEVPTNINDKEEGYSLMSSNDFSNKMKEEFQSTDFAINKDYCRYTAWTNDSIKGANGMIRNFLTELINDPIRVGEFVMSYKTITDKYEGTFIVNSEEYVIKQVEATKNSHGLDGWMIIMKCLSTEDDTPKLFIVNPASYKEFLKIHDEYLKDAKQFKGQAWTDYYNFKNFNLLMNDIKDDRGKLLVSKDLDYGYGITVHKTQGSTYDNIFVNLKNIRINPNITEKKKLMYVALSRARKRVYIYDKV